MRRALAILLQLAGALTLLAALVGGGLVLTAGLWLRMDEPPRPGAAIVVLAGDLRRAIHAADLYHQGLAPVVYVGRPHYDPPQALCDLGFDCPRQEDQMLRVLERKGVPREALRLYGQELMSTVQEAEALKAELAASALGPGPLLVVTSPYHCRRAKLILAARVRDRELVMTPTPYERFDARWWAHQGSAGAVVSEVAKLVFHALGTPFRSVPAGMR